MPVARLSEPTADVGRYAALGTSLLVAGMGAFAAGQLELLLLAGTGAFMMTAHVIAARTERRRRDALRRFLGDEHVVEGPGTWTSLDGRRRLRVATPDADARWEEIDPATGETLQSFRGPAPLAPHPPCTPEVLERRVARVHGRVREPRCFAGLPAELGGRGAAVGTTATIVLELTRAGVLVERRDASGELVGDTWHPDRSSALRQLELEYGDRIGAWHDEADFVPIAPVNGWDEPVKTRLAL